MTTPEGGPGGEGREMASDKEAADFLIFHMGNPCEVDVGGSSKDNLFDFYLREAKRLLPTFTDSEQRDRLQKVVDTWEDLLGKG